LRLEVEAVDVAGAAILDDEDARFLRAASAAGRGAGVQQLGQTEAEHADAADVQELATRQKRMAHGFPLAIHAITVAIGVRLL
jgi:hypothetical protein